MSNADLVIMKNNICISVLSRNCIRPQLLHEENLICELRSHAVLRRPSFLNPIRQVPYKVKKEIALGNTNY